MKNQKPSFLLARSHQKKNRAEFTSAKANEISLVSKFPSRFHKGMAVYRTNLHGVK